MTYFCCKYTDGNKNLISQYVRNEEEFFNICRDVRRKGFIPVKSKITVSSESVRTETALK